jgi:hypothetical protein
MWTAWAAQVLANDGSGAAPLTEHVREGVLGRMVRYGGAEALRCLALACKTLPLADAPVRPGCPRAAGKADERKRLHALGSVSVPVRRRCLPMWVWLCFQRGGQARMSVGRLGCLAPAELAQRPVAHCAYAIKHMLGVYLRGNANCTDCCANTVRHASALLSNTHALLAEQAPETPEVRSCTGGARG